MSKTPEFDRALDKILDTLIPREQACMGCGAHFSIMAEDISFYKLFRVPPPRRCPPCRREQRLAFLNYTTLYKRPCEVPGHHEEIISGIPKGAPFPVYDWGYYWSDAWSAESFGETYEPNIPWFEQLEALFRRVPQPALTRDVSNVRSEYVLYGSELKDCYYTFGGIKSENSAYSNWPINSKDCMDTLLALDTTDAYEGIFPEKCYNCDFTYFSKDCLDSSFLYDCRNCTNCFGCVNLRNKKFYFFNEPFTEEAYREKMNAINRGDREVLREHQSHFWDLVRQLPVRATRNEHSERVIGNYISDSKDCYMAFWVWSSERLRYGDFTMKMKDCMDFAIGLNTERLYETAAVTRECSSVKFSSNSRAVADSEFLIECRNCTNCFGCIGLRGKKYCILNRQYTPEEYWRIVDAIKAKLLSEKSYGEFLPLKFSSFPWNASLAQMVFPKTEAEVRSRGGWWYEEFAARNENAIPSVELPADIHLATDNILEKAIAGESSGRPFRITAKELAFYRRKELPLPTKHPSERMHDRFAKVNFFKIAEDHCASCGISVYSSYNSTVGFKPYCEACYQKEVV